MDEAKLNNLENFYFWTAIVLSLGLNFLVIYFLDGLTPREIIKYVHRK